MRVLGEIQMLRKRAESAISYLNKSIQSLKEVGNPRQLWQSHASLASNLDRLGKHSEARDQWGAAVAVIQRQAENLSEPELRAGFLEARPIRKILANAEN